MKNRAKKMVAGTVVLSMCIFATVGYAKDEGAAIADNTLQQFVQKGYLDAIEGAIQPHEVVNRAQFVTMVNGLLGLTQYVDTMEQFADVSQEQWYYMQFSKALAAGYISGTSSSTLSPEAPLTVEQGAVIIGRLLQLENEDETVLDKFVDGQQVADYAKPMVSAMVAKGYLTSEQDNQLQAQQGVTLEKVVSMLTQVESIIVEHGVEQQSMTDQDNSVVDAVTSATSAATAAIFSPPAVIYQDASNIGQITGQVEILFNYTTKAEKDYFDAIAQQGALVLLEYGSHTQVRNDQLDYSKSTKVRYNNTVGVLTIPIGQSKLDTAQKYSVRISSQGNAATMATIHLILQ